jgi:2-C-methyl-D-erythritol 4-phosphate cytidylyltransferase
MNAGLILAGGVGARLTSGIPKQFIEVGGKPLINYTLRVFGNCAGIAMICVVIAKKYENLLNGDYLCAAPGKSRQHSIYNGLSALRKYSPKYIIIHDAVRPLVTESDIMGCIGAARDYDGATPVLPMSDTIYSSADGKTITSLLNRDELFAGQTPECYDFEKYFSAHKNLTDEELGNIRGSSELAVKSGMGIALCNGRPDNFKITANADLERFKSIIEKGNLNESMGFAGDKRSAV